MTLDEIMIEQYRRRLTRGIEHEIFKYYGVKMFWNLIWSDNGKPATISIPFDPEKHPETAQLIRDGLERLKKKETVHAAWAELPTKNPCAEIPLGKPEISVTMHPIPREVLQEITAKARDSHSKRMNECLTMIGEGLIAAANQGQSEVILTLPWDAKVHDKIKALYSQLITDIALTDTINQAKVTFRWTTYQEEKNVEFARRYGSTEAKA